MVKLSKFLPLCLCTAAFSSCVDADYDLRTMEIDTTVSIGGDNLAIPIGVTDTVWVASFMNFDGSSISVLEDGTYAMYQEGTEFMQMPSLDCSGLKQNNIYIDRSVSLLPVSGARQTDLPPVEFSEDFKFGITMELPREVVSLDSIEFSKMMLHMRLEPSYGFSGTADCDLTFDFGDDFRIEGGITENIYDYSKNDVTFPLDIYIPVRAILLDGSVVDSRFEWSGNVTAGGDICFRNLESLPSSIEMTVSLENITPDRFTGRINADIPVTTFEYRLENLPEIFTDGDVVPDFYNPYMQFDIVSNLTMPVTSFVNVHSYSGGHPSDMNFSIQLPYTDSEQESAVSYEISKYKVSSSPDVVHIEENLSQIMNPVPDLFVFDFSPVISSEEPCVYSVNEEYQAYLDYSFYIPFMFGKDFTVSFSEKIDNISSEVSDLLRDNTLSLYGEFTNSLPLDLHLVLVCLDYAGNELPVRSNEIIIPSSDSNGKESKSSFTARMEGNTDENISAIELRFTASGNETVQGLPVNEKDFIIVKLGARMEGGFITDLNKK